MKYNSICCVCGRQTPYCDHIVEHAYLKEKMGFIEVQINWPSRKINFCPSCSRKSYTIEELKTVGNYNQWSY
ncbi:MAG: hypothetical protein GTO02_23005 [Candidatus Dadabacteria bacterium]|nr:hypothetical protein [Candidatus Dadabacteria bacterium]